MKKKDAKYFRKLLTRRIKELLGHTEGTVTGMTTPKEKLPDPTDRATLEADLNYNLRIKNRERANGLKGPRQRNHHNRQAIRSAKIPKGY